MHNYYTLWYRIIFKHLKIYFRYFFKQKENSFKLDARDFYSSLLYYYTKMEALFSSKLKIFFEQEESSFKPIDNYIKHTGRWRRHFLVDETILPFASRFFENLFARTTPFLNEYFRLFILILC
jgi:hypothetical protein